MGFQSSFPLLPVHDVTKSGRNLPVMWRSTLKTDEVKLRSVTEIAPKLPSWTVLSFPIFCDHSLRVQTHAMGISNLRQPTNSRVLARFNPPLPLLQTPLNFIQANSLTLRKSSLFSMVSEGLEPDTSWLRLCGRPLTKQPYWKGKPPSRIGFSRFCSATF